MQFAQRFVSISFPDITVVGAESCRKLEDMTQTYRDFVKEIYTEMPRNRGNLITDLSPLASRRFISLIIFQLLPHIRCLNDFVIP